MKDVLLLSEVLASRKGTITYSISGTINDSAGSGLSGVTITLTGDASDSTTTAGDGTYSLSGLSNGSYTVTPTKAGSTFNPSSANVTISGGNQTATTMAQVWEIAGDIVDKAAAALSGVLVTLSGDASDTDTSDVSGAYSFPNLADGSYVVTPSLATYSFSPASSNETVAGADVAVSNFAGYVFPITMTAAQLNSGIAASAGTWTLQSVNADSNGYTPSGITQELLHDPDGDANDFAAIDIGYALPDGLFSSGLRVELLVRCVSDAGGAVGMLLGAAYTTRAACLAADRFYTRHTGDADKTQIVLANDVPTVFLNSETSVTAIVVTRWLRYRVTLNHGTQTMTATVFEHQTPANSTGDKSGAYSAAWGSLSIGGLRYLMPYHYAAANQDIVIGRLWVGDLNDDWPS